ncbi:hypothetical protein MMC34_000216 [Xylographa carneopallida]|nr:hypothetical protein [Xylographa carneopallida]
MASTEQRRTAESLVDAFNRMDIDKIISLRSPDCTNQILPRSIKLPVQDNGPYEKRLRFLHPIFKNFSLTVEDMLEDIEARRICMWLYAKADTAAGQYLNEYVWILQFDESGKQIISQKEYVDTLMQKEFYPKLQAAGLAQTKKD